MLRIPIAHGEGRFVCRQESDLERLVQNSQIVLRYAPAESPCGAAHSALRTPQAPLPYPINPNGSQANIAGICDVTGRVFGLMPHPERHVDPTQHPQWTRRPPCEEGDGLVIFRNAVGFFTT